MGESFPVSKMGRHSPTCIRNFKNIFGVYTLGPTLKWGMGGRRGKGGGGSCGPNDFPFRCAVPDIDQILSSVMCYIDPYKSQLQCAIISVYVASKKLKSFESYCAIDMHVMCRPRMSVVALDMLVS